MSAIKASTNDISMFELKGLIHPSCIVRGISISWLALVVFIVMVHATGNNKGKQRSSACKSMLDEANPLAVEEHLENDKLLIGIKYFLDTRYCSTSPC